MKITIEEYKGEKYTAIWHESQNKITITHAMHNGKRAEIAIRENV